MRAAGIMLALAGAVLLQTIIAGVAIGGDVLVNLVLVTVIYVALAYGPVAGLLAGTAGGLLQDALAGGIVGIGGFAKTSVGFLVGVLGAQFIVAQWLPRLVMFFGATMLHELCFQALHALVESRAFTIHYPAALTQAGVNAVIGVIAFQVVEATPGVVQRRRARGATLSRRNY